MWEKEEFGYFWKSRFGQMTPPSHWVSKEGVHINKMGEVMKEKSLSLTPNNSPLILRGGLKRKPTIVFGSVKTQRPIVRSKKKVNNLDKDLAEIIKIFVTEGEVEQYLPEVKVAFEETYDFSTIAYIETNIADLKIVNANNVHKSLVERLDDEDAEYLGGYKIELIQEAFRNLQGHQITDGLLSTLAIKDDQEAIGILMANTKGLIQEFVTIMLNKYGTKQIITDIIMGGEETHLLNIQGKPYYVGGY